jgi:hypothetical protein
LATHHAGIVLQRRRSEPVLAAELPIKRGLRDARALADGVDRHLGTLVPVGGRGHLQNRLTQPIQDKVLTELQLEGVLGGVSA